MKKSRKQKLRERQDRKDGARQRKEAIVGRVLEMLDIEEPLAPILATLREEFAKRVGPSVEVVASEKSRGDEIVEAARRLIETIVERPMPLTAGGRSITLSLGDFYRGYFAVTGLMGGLFRYLQSTKITRPSAAVPGFREACARIERFTTQDLDDVFGRLVYQLNRIVDFELRYEQHIVWYRIERNPKYPGRRAYRIVVGKRLQVPHYLPFHGQRRKCYPCEVLDPLAGLCPLTWKPAELGVGDSGKAIPVYISDHAIARLYQRLPLAPLFDLHHKILRGALESPRVHPSTREGEYLVEAGEPDRKLGYFVVAVLPDFVYVKTFLFLTMHGTPEAKRLRTRAGLSRNDIIAFKLDNFITLGYSDIGEDPVLKALLADCGCDHLLDVFGSDNPLSWLGSYRDPLRRAAGLSILGQDAQEPGEAQAGKFTTDAMVACAERFLKASQGWTT